MSTEKVRLPRHRIVNLRTNSSKSTARRSNAINSTQSTTPDPPSSTHETANNNTNTIILEKDSPEYLQLLIGKLLYPNLDCPNYKDALPSLTTSNDVDIQLYPFIGLLFRSFINKWYKNITDDTEFTTELITVVAQITRELESRMARVDVMELLLDDIPFVLDQHLSAFRRVLKELGSSYLPFDTIDNGYDYLSNHRAFTKSPVDKKDYLKMLANNVLERLLPPTEENSELVKKFVGALVGDMLLNIITTKLSQPYQIFEIITLMCKNLVGNDPTEDEKKPEPIDVSKHVDQEKITQQHKTKFTSIISSISHFIADTASPSRPSKENKPQQKNLTSLHIFAFLNNLFNVDTHRPVLFALLKSLVPILNQDKVNHMISNLIANKLVAPVRSDTLFANVIKAGRNNLFPTDEDMGPPRIEPDLEECEQIRLTTKTYILKVCKKFHPISYLLLATKDDELDGVIDDFLTSFEHPRVNEHLVMKLIDLLVLRLFPELSDSKCS